MRTDKQTVGDYGETIAVRYLRRHGYRIQARNWQSNHHELDIIAVRFSVIAFVEVKTRTYTDETFGVLPPPRHAVKSDKQNFTRQAARQYLGTHPTWRKPRMDVIEVFLAPASPTKKTRVRRIHHITGAY